MTKGTLGARAPQGVSDDLAEQIKQYVEPGDWALIVNFHGGSTPSETTLRWETLGFDDRIEWGPYRFDAAKKERLRAFPIVGPVVRAWTEALEDIRACVSRVCEVCRARIHVFFSGPYPAAAYLGQCLDTAAGQRPVFVYQYDGRAKAWVPFLLPPSLAEQHGTREYFAPYRPPCVDGVAGGYGYGVSVEGRWDAGEALLRDVAHQERLECVYRLRPAGPEWLTSVPQAHGALNQLEKVLSRLREERPNEPVHILTSVPLALMVGLGMRLRNTVRGRVVVHQFSPRPRAPDTAGKEGQPPALGKETPAKEFYYPVLEVMKPRVICVEGNRLEVFVGEGGMLMYALNGQVLRAARQVPGFPAPAEQVNRRTDDKKLLFEQAALFSERVLTPAVDQAIVNCDRLDVEVRLSEDAADLPWEFLFSRLNDHPLGVREGHTLARFVDSPRTLQPRRPDQPLRILIAPVLPEAECEKYSRVLQLEALKATLEQAGALVELMENEAPEEEVRNKLSTFRPDIFHWIGHGGSDSRGAYKGIVAIKSQGQQCILDRIHFRLMMGAEFCPRVVLLTACLLGGGLEEFGVPRNLIWDGVGAVVSFRDVVRVREAATFSRAFYSAILRGSTVGEAVAAGRRDLYRAFGANEGLPGSFGAPVLACSSVEALEPLVVEGITPRYRTSTMGTTGDDELPLPTPTPDPSRSSPPGRPGENSPPLPTRPPEHSRTSTMGTPGDDELPLPTTTPPPDDDPGDDALSLP